MNPPAVVRPISPFSKPQCSKLCRNNRQLFHSKYRRRSRCRDDYTATSGTATIAAGQTSTTVNVPVLYDSVYSPSRTLDLNFSSPTNVTLATTQVIGTINDQTKPSISSANASVNQPPVGNTTVLPFTIQLSTPSTLATTVSYTTANIAGGAVAGVDYTATSGTATIAAGQTSTIVDIPILYDGTYNPNLAFDLDLSNPSNATLATTTVIGTIVQPQPTISVANASVNEACCR